MKVFHVFLPTILVVISLSSVLGINFGFRRVRSDGTGALSRRPPRDYEPIGCAQGRYLNPQTSNKMTPAISALHQGRIYEAASAQSQPLQPTVPLQNSSPVSVQGKNKARPIQLTTADYYVYDNFRRRTLEFFDPEEWVCCNRYVPFPSELDIPRGWAIYNPVTVQAPQPTIIKDLAQYKYSGYYYSCPNYANPYDFSWYFNYNTATNPCKWIWYQSHKDAEYSLAEVTYPNSRPLTL